MKTEYNWKIKIWLFFISQGITLFGSTLVQMAVIWYVTLDTSKGIWVAVFSVCSYLPQFLMSFAGGVWADRYRKKRLIMASDAGIAAVTLAVFFLLPACGLGWKGLSVLLLMSGLRSVGAGIQTPAVNAVIPQLVPAPWLMRYNGINAAIQSVVQFAAPAAAGVLLSALSLRMALLVDVFTAILGIGLLSRIEIPGQKTLREERAFLKELGEGIHYTVANPIIGRILLLYGFFVLMCVPGGFLAGLLVSQVYGDTYWYLTVTELSGFAGMTAGGMLMGIWGGFQEPTDRLGIRGNLRTLSAGLICFGILSAAMGMGAAFSIYLILMAMYGVALTTVQTAVSASLQAGTDSWMQGRILGMMGAVYSGALPLGMAFFGPLADLWPLSGMMIVCGIGLIVSGIFVRFQKNFVQ